MIFFFQIISNKKESTLESQKQEKSVPPKSSTELLDKLKNKKKGPENQTADPSLIQLNAESSQTHKVTSKDRESRTNASDEISYSNIDNERMILTTATIMQV